MLRILAKAIKTTDMAATYQEPGFHEQEAMALRRRLLSKDHKAAYVSAAQQAGYEAAGCVTTEPLDPGGCVVNARKLKAESNDIESPQEEVPGRENDSIKPWDHTPDDSIHTLQTDLSALSVGSSLSGSLNTTGGSDRDRQTSHGNTTKSSVTDPK